MQMTNTTLVMLKVRFLPYCHPRAHLDIVAHYVLFGGLANGRTGGWFGVIVVGVVEFGELCGGAVMLPASW